MPIHALRFRVSLYPTAPLYCICSFFPSFSLCLRSGCLMYKDRPRLCLSFYPLDYRMFVQDTPSSGCLEALYYIYLCKVTRCMSIE